MIKIIFFCDWGTSSIDLLSKYKLFTKNNKGMWKNIIGTTNIDDADYIIFIEGIPKNFYFPLLKNKKIICLPREPHKSKNWEKLKLEHGYTYDTIFHVVTNPQFIDKTYDLLLNLQHGKSNNKLSAIISNKNKLKGHKLRKKFIVQLAKSYPSLCDIYGKGWGNELGISYKGELGNYHHIDKRKTTKYDGLINYRYSLCLENSVKKNYFTEKFTDAILCWTIPIYWGCPNISEYFPKHSYHSIDIKDPKCIDNVVEIINTPVTQENIDALHTSRDLILNKYNIWNVIHELI